jgi:hypothetical protein
MLVRLYFPASCLIYFSWSVCFPPAAQDFSETHNEQADFIFYFMGRPFIPLNHDWHPQLFSAAALAALRLIDDLIFDIRASFSIWLFLPRACAADLPLFNCAFHLHVRSRQ